MAPGARVIAVGGARAIEAEHLSLAPQGVDELLDYLRAFPARGWRKALVFCNSRAEVEAYATAVRDRTPFGGAVYVHYSNIEARRRRETERHFADARAALLFATSTLELGVDIGDIDVVVLVGPPGSTESFVQRIGRGNRRQEITRVACLFRSPLERLIFEALTMQTPDSSLAAEPSSYALGSDPFTRPRSPSAARRLRSTMAPPGDRRAADMSAISYESQAVFEGPQSQADTASNRPQSASFAMRPQSQVSSLPFRPSVAVQQIFSLLKQSPSGALRLAELAALCEGMLAPDDLEAVLEHLHRIE